MAEQSNFVGKIRKQISTGWHWFVEKIPLIIVLTFVGTVALWLYSFNWSGFGSYIDSDGKTVPAKTLWDWLGLLLVPAFLAIGGISINAGLQQIERERAEKRAESERQIADDRQREQALQTYFDRMSELLLSGRLDDPDAGEKAKAVARARTLTTLRGLNGERKAAVLQFLYESKLISGKTATIDLSTADFTQDDLADMNLEEANLSDVNLTNTHLEGASLMMAFLIQATLKEAHLEGTFFTGANLESANLVRANLKWAHLSAANFTMAFLMRANLEGADMVDAILKGANLAGAMVTQEQLESAILDETTILPDGSHYKPPAS